jgi:transcriptional regulator with XRE-family HTH domain
VCQIETLGERIRKLRKQQKLTLEALAGSDLTKGMLSLIENNKANPSMESLSYIAERLGVEVSVLLEEVSIQELRDVLEEAETLYNTDLDKLTDEYQQLITLVKPFIDKLTQGYESARLLEIYSRCLYREKIDGWQELSDKAAHIYEQMNLSARRAGIGIFRSMVKFTEHDYEQALDIILRERAEIEAKHVVIDPKTRLDFDYHEAVLHFAVGDSIEAVRVMNEAIEFSKNNQLFYRIDHLYRLVAAHAMMTQDKDRMDYYFKKLIQYGEFADDEEAIIFVKFAEIHYLNSYKNSFIEALLLSDQYLQKDGSSNFYIPFLYLEKGKALYGTKKYEEALHFLDQVTIADYIHHPFDLSIFYLCEAYEALCHMELGNSIDAIRYAEIAKKNISSMPQTPYKKFIFETYDFILQKTTDN